MRTRFQSSIFVDRHVKDDWIHSLNRIPNRIIMRIRMLQFVRELNALEFARTVKDSREDLTELTHMWKDSHHKENFCSLLPILYFE